MKKNLIIILLSFIILSEIICITSLCVSKEQDKNATNITIRELPQQTVLYTIYRGKYYKINQTIQQLYALAKEKGISTCGKATTCFLNSPVAESENHQLIEIQIPVDNTAMNHSGTLGTMTDVKKVPAMKVAVAIKPEGFDDPTPVIADLFSWINKNGYIVRGRMSQSILDEGKGCYLNLRTEFFIPIDKISYKDLPTLRVNPCYM